MVGFMGLIFLVCRSANKRGKVSSFMFYSICRTLYLRVLLSSAILLFWGSFTLVKNVPKEKAYESIS